MDMIDLSLYPEDHGPFCHKSCDHPCHDAYDKAREAFIQHPSNTEGE